MSIEERFIDGFLVQRISSNDEDEVHNANGPALTMWNRITKNIVREAYYINGELDRIGAPANIMWYADGSLYKESYYIKGFLHNENGPAIIEYGEDGTIVKKYYVADWLYSEEKYYQKYPNAAGNPQSIIAEENVCSVCRNKDEFLSAHKRTGKLVCYKCCE